MKKKIYIIISTRRVSSQINLLGDQTFIINCILQDSTAIGVIVEQDYWVLPWNSEALEFNVNCMKRLQFLPY